MNKKEILEKLYELKNLYIDFDKINLQYSELQIKFQKLNNELEYAKSFQPRNLINFDKEKLEKYIISKIGNAPVYKKPSIFKFFSHSKEEYEILSYQYKLNYEKCLDKYYEEFSFERDLMKEKDFKEKEILINNVTLKIQECESKFEEYNILMTNLKDKIKDNHILIDKFKNFKSVCEIIELIENDRFTSIVDAINYLEIFNTINEIKDSINSKINELESTIEGLSSDVFDLEENVEKIESNLLNIYSKIDSVENDILDLDRKINYVDSLID